MPKSKKQYPKSGETWKLLGQKIRILSSDNIKKDFFGKVTWYLESENPSHSHTMCIMDLLNNGASKIV